MLNCLSLMPVVFLCFMALLHLAWSCWHDVWVRTSHGSSLVLYWRHVMLANSRSAWQRAVQTISIIANVVSVWRCTLAYACQVTSRNISSLMLLLSSSGNNPSNTGIAHCYRCYRLGLSCHVVEYVPVIYLCSLKWLVCSSLRLSLVACRCRDWKWVCYETWDSMKESALCSYKLLALPVIENPYKLCSLAWDHIEHPD